MLTPPAWFLKELQLISPNLKPYYLAKHRKWLIVKEFPRRVLGITEYDPISGKHYVVEFVVEDEKHNPRPLDNRIIEVLKEIKQRREKNVSIEREIDEANEKRKKDMMKIRMDAQREFCRWLYKLEHSRTFS